MGDETELLCGTLDLLILKAVRSNRFTVARFFRESNKFPANGSVVYRTGALYPALFRQVRQGLLKTYWENRRTLQA